MKKGKKGSGEKGWYGRDRGEEKRKGGGRRG